jgi:hypothetical protein
MQLSADQSDEVAGENASVSNSSSEGIQEAM